MCGVVGLLIRDPALEPLLGLDAGPDDRGPRRARPRLLGHRRLRRHRPALDGADVRSDADSLGQPTRGRLDGRRRDACSTCGRSAADAAAASAPGSWSTCPRRRLDDVQRRPGAEWPRRAGARHRAATCGCSRTPGGPTDTCARYGIGDWQGYLAVAHTRMATESAVTVLHSHPFVPARDLCVVHNGSFSNYATVRRRLRGRRRHASTPTTTPRWRPASWPPAWPRGDDLEEATRWVMKEMDGFFTLVITTADEMSVVRDAFACKPAVVAETDRLRGRGLGVPGPGRPARHRRRPRSSSPNPRRSTRGAADRDRRSTATPRHPGRSTAALRAAARRARRPGSLQPRGPPQPGRRADRAGVASPSRATPATSSAAWAAAGTAPAPTSWSTASSAGRSARTSWAAPSGSGAAPRRAPGSSARGGRIVIEGDASLRAGISLKGGTLAIAGDAGAMTGFMAQAGTILIGGDAGHGLGRLALRGGHLRGRRDRLARRRRPGRGAHRRGRAGGQAAGRGDRLRPHRPRAA